MKKTFALILVSALVIIGSFVALTAHAVTILPSFGGGTGFGTYTQGDLIYSSALNVLSKLGIGGSGTCLTSNGTIPVWGGCTSGGAGSGTVSTSTPLVSGQVDFSTGVNTIGNDSTFLFDSTTKKLTTTNFQTTSATSTNATSTNFFATTASTTNLFGQFFNGFGLATCTGTNALTWSGGSFSCTAQPQGTVTAVTGTWPIISSGGATPNLTWGGLSTSTNPTVGQVPYWTAANTFGSVATSSLVQSTGVNIANGTTAYVLGAQPTFTVDQNFAPTWTGAHIFNNITRSTTTQATTTNLSVGILFRSGTTDGCGTWSGGILSSTGVACGSGSGGTNTDKFATSTDTNYPANKGIYPNGTTINLGLGTTTPQWNLQSASSTGAQLVLSDPSVLTNNHFAFRNAGGNLYIATSSPSTFATSTFTALTIDKNGFLGIGSSTPTVPLSVTGNINQNGTWAHFGSANCGTGGVMAGNLIGSETCGNDNNTTGGVQVIVGNTNAGANAWGGFTVNNNLADNTITHFLGLYYNSSGYTDTTFGTAIARKNLGLLQNTDGTLALISSSSTEALAPQGIEFITGGTATANIRGRIDPLGRFGFGTTTPQWLLQLASSTGPQLTLSDPSVATFNHWSMRNAGGLFYLATSSPSTFASSSVSALSINANGQLTVPFYGGVTGCAQFSSTGVLSNTGSACGSGGGGTNTDKFASSTDGLTIYPNGITTNVGIGAVPLRATNALLNLFATSTTGNLINASSTTNFLGNFLNFNNAAGTSLFKVDSAGTVVIGDGTVTSPALAFADDTNNGLYSPANDIFAIATNGVERMRIDDGTGYTGWGTTTPQWLFELATSTRSQLTLASGIGTEIPWSFRSVGSNLYIATSSPSTYATSSVSAFSLNANGIPTFPSLGTGIVKATAGVLSSLTTVPVANGGTNLTTFGGTNTLLYTSSADTLTSLAQGGANVMLTANSGAPAWSASPTLNTSLTVPLLVGGTGVGSTLTVQSTSGVGTSDAILFKVGNNGGTEAARFTTGGRFGLGTTTPTWDLTIASTSPVLELDDTNGATSNKHLIMTFNDGIFSMGTSSDSTLTSTSSAMTVTPGVSASLYVATSSNLSNSGAVFATQGTVFMGGLTASAGLQTGIVCLSATNQLINESVACVASSKRFKENWHPLTSSLSEVLALKPVSFFYKPSFNGPLQSNPNFSGEQVGFLAEDVQKIDPRLVSVETEGTDVGKPHTVRYENMTALLAGAIQELNQKVQGTKRSVEENWQDGLIALLFLYVGYNEFDKRRRK